MRSTNESGHAHVDHTKVIEWTWSQITIRPCPEHLIATATKIRQVAAHFGLNVNAKTTMLSAMISAMIYTSGEGSPVELVEGMYVTVDRRTEDITVHMEGGHNAPSIGEDAGIL